MNACRRIVRSTLVLLALAVPGSSFAEASAVAGPRWACWYEAGDLTIQCLLSRTPKSGLEARALDADRTTDRRLPELVRTLRGSPEQLATNRISIPLWNTPSEMDFARELAQSVMCGMRADCSVNFDVNPDGRAPIRAAALQAGADEAEVMAEVAHLQVLAQADVAEPRRTSRRRRA
jgi:hypothetical protein